MQHPPQMAPPMPSYPPANITSDQIQKFLDENKKLILAILDNQNLGKLNECAQYQAQLQKNLMYLAAIADAQPQTPTIPAQVAPPHPAMQTGGVYMQHPQAAGAMAQQQPGGMLFPQKGPLQFSSPQQMQEYALQHQQQQQQMQLQMQQQAAMQGQISMRPGAPNNSMYFQQQQQQQTDAALGGGAGSMPPRTAAGQNKQSSDAGPAGGGDGAGDGETSRAAKGGEESNK